MQSCLGGRWGCDAWGSSSRQSQMPITSQAPPPIDAQNARAGVVPAQRSESKEISLKDAKKQEQASEQSSRQEAPSPSQKNQRNTSLGAFSEGLFRPADDDEANDKRKEVYWVSPSLAAWLTGKGRTRGDSAESVKTIIEKAVDKKDLFEEKGDKEKTDETDKALDIAVDFSTSDHANQKKVIISGGDPQKREKAVAIMKELTTKCQRDNASSLIDNWQSFSDDRLREENPTPTSVSSRSQPKFGLSFLDSLLVEGDGRGARKDKDVEKTPITITALRRNLVSKYERDVHHTEEDRRRHQHHQDSIRMQVLKLDFPLATLPLPPEITKNVFEAELKNHFVELKKSAEANNGYFPDNLAAPRIEANVHVGTHATADISVVDGALEDLRSVLGKYPPTVQTYKAVVPEKLVWCETCQQAHEPDKLCYKNFQVDGRFDESLTSFLGQCQSMHFDTVGI